MQIAQDSSFEDMTSQNEKWKSYINREVTLTTFAMYPKEIDNRAFLTNNYQYCTNDHMKNIM